MSLLNKLISGENSSVSRRDFLRDGSRDLFVIFGLDGLFSHLYSDNKGSSLFFKPTEFIKKNSWIKNEIISFLDQEEVKKELGFNPLNYDKNIDLSIQEGSILIGYGTHYNDGSAWINGHLFSNSDPRIELKRNGFKKEKYQKDLDKLKELRQNKEMLKLYRGLLVTHEIAHMGEFYSAKAGNPITLTGHGVNDRIEVKILNNLYKSGKIKEDTYMKVINFFEKYSR